MGAVNANWVVGLLLGLVGFALPLGLGLELLLLGLCLPPGRGRGVLAAIGGALLALYLGFVSVMSGGNSIGWVAVFLLGLALLLWGLRLPLSRGSGIALAVVGSALLAGLGCLAMAYFIMHGPVV
ncbi:MAG: hypothetical protein LBD02_05740 [Christensenellaceae bacterium]|nr:hypothetical protein [Christensenellaceae bacterium]